MSSKAFFCISGQTLPRAINTTKCLSREFGFGFRNYLITYVSPQGSHRPGKTSLHPVFVKSGKNLCVQGFKVFFLLHFLQYIFNIFLVGNINQKEQLLSSFFKTSQPNNLLSIIIIFFSLTRL